MRKVPSELGWLELPHDNQSSARKALPVQVSHRFTPASAVFDDDSLVSCAGLVPVMTLAAQTGLPTLLADKIDVAVPRIKSGSANPSPKLTTVIAGMCAGADSIDDLDVVRFGWDEGTLRRCVRALDGRNPVARVHLRARPSAGISPA